MHRSFRRIVCLFLGLGVSISCYGKLSGSLEKDAIRDRLLPIGKLNIDGAPDLSKKEEKSLVRGPEQIYKNNCHVCHDAGVAGAPKLSDKAAWSKRKEQGMDVLLRHAIDGFKAMPPKGNCIDCSENDLKQTIEYMSNFSK